MVEYEFKFRVHDYTTGEIWETNERSVAIRRYNERCSYHHEVTFVEAPC